MESLKGDTDRSPLRCCFDCRLKLEFRGSRVTSDSGLFADRVLEEAIGLTAMAGGVDADSRTGQQRDPLDVPVKPEGQPQRRPAAASRASPQPGQLYAEASLPDALGWWSVAGRREKHIKIGAKTVRHGRYVIFQMATVAISRDLFADILPHADRLGPTTASI
jgi:hypothetical protein